MDVASVVRELTAAGEFLRDSHSQALGTIQQRITELRKENEIEQVQRQSAHRRQVSEAQARARNNLIAAELKVIDVIDRMSARSGLDGIGVRESIELGQILINAKSSGIHKELSIPLIVPFLGSNNLLIVGDQTAQEDMLLNAVLECILYSSPGAVEITTFDPLLKNRLSSFAGINDLRPGLLTVLHTEKELAKRLEHLRSRVSRMGNLCKGLTRGYLDYIEESSDLPESFELYCLQDYPVGLPERVHNQLIPILKTAPHAGISFLIQIANKADHPEWFTSDRLKELLGLGDNFEVSKERCKWSGNKKFNIAVPQCSSTDALSAISSFIDSAEKKMKILLSDILPQNEWQYSSAEGLTFAFAGRNKKPMEITLGDSLVHGLITGATGQGKSNLIKVLIYDLASRYSPDELEFILLDFKEGVTLAPFAPMPGQPDYLPHARVLGLDADQQYGLAVLQEIERIYKRRMKQMKPYDSIRAYREAQPNERMPRIVVVIDEFQGLLAEDSERIGIAASKKLMELIRTVRAAGIHIILATQEIGSIPSLVGKRDGLLSQLKLRVGLKNTPKEAIQTFDVGNDAAAHLKIRGEVVVNADFGALESNQIGVVPYADDESLTSLRVKWWEKTKETISAPQVFDGTKLANWDSEWRIHTDCHDVSDSPLVFLGQPIQVAPTPIMFDFNRVPGRNLAFVGASAAGARSDDDYAAQHPLTGLVVAALALADQYRHNKIRIDVLNLLVGADCMAFQVDKLIAILAKNGADVRVFMQRDIPEWIEATYEDFSQRQSDSSPAFILGLGMDRIGSLDGKYKSTIKRYSSVLTEIFEQGPARGLHTIAWWANGESFLTHTERKVEKYFSGILLYSGTESVAKRVIGPLATWNGEFNRAMFKDFSSGEGAMKIVPYSYPDLALRDVQEG